ncbi:MAG: aspartate aminotransferase family protein [Planctomycetota bacterium]|nr:aspartate aminotransferase family protein [Planctomycetota bacterium]
MIHSMHSAELTSQAKVWTSGHGAVLVDSNGREYLDALAGLWNVLVGHGNEQLAQAASEQMRRLAFVSTYSGGTNRPAIALAERLAEICYPSINRFFLTTSGSEANEAAFKTARYYWQQLGQPSKTRFLALTHSYHGTTAACTAATGTPRYWEMCEPRTPGFVHVPSPYPYRFEQDNPSAQSASHLLEQTIVREGAETIAAFIAEPVQAAGGTIVPLPEYWPQVRDICTRHKILLIADEVVTGFGRTGWDTSSGNSWFALSRYNIEPDMITIAKGMTSGYFPMGSLGVNDTIADGINNAPRDQLWTHGSTNSAHPVGCAVALANLDILQKEGLLQRNAENGARLLAGLQTLFSHPHVGDVRAAGSLACVELVQDCNSKTPFAPEKQIGQQVHAAALRRGMVSRHRGDTYQFAPPYVTTGAQIDRMVQILADSINEVCCF